MASTTYIDLTNELLRRVNEQPIDETDFDNVRGVHHNAKDAINAAIEDIFQSEMVWPFSALSTTQLLVEGQEDYDWPTDLKIANWRSFMILRDDTLNEAGHPLEYHSRDVYYKALKSEDDYAGTDGLDVPLFVFEKHGFGFTVSPSPSEAYTVSYDYWANHVNLVDATDTSLVPSNYDEVILQGALYHMYMFRANAEAAQITQERFMRLLGTMRTVLINKEDRVRSGMLNRRRYVGRLAIPVDGWYM